jgi:hypothetical protein
MTKILHVWDQAGVACVLAKYQQKLGHESKVIKRAGFDKMKIFSFYRGTEFKTMFGSKFLKIAEKEAGKYDIIHVHDLFNLVPNLKKKYPNKKIILQYHGSRLRKTPQEKRSKDECFADKILVSTPDLKEFVDSEYIPNPIDTEHFSIKKKIRNNKALCIMTESETKEEVSKFLKKYKIELNYDEISRKDNPVLYNDMPNFLSHYEYYIDLKIDELGNNRKFLSMTGLQALSLGVKVLNYNFKIINKLPEQHYPENVIEKLMKIYNY